MSGITAIQPLSPAETWEAWQALMQASLGEAQPHGEAPLDGHVPAPLQARPADALPADIQVQPDVPTTAPTPAAPPLSSLREAPQAANAARPHGPGLPVDMPVAAAHVVDSSASVLPMAPVLLTPLALQNGPELRWRTQDATLWRALFDDASRDAPDEEEPGALPMPTPDALEIDAMPPWAQTLLARLREAAAAPVSAAALRPALQAWRLGLPVLLASPAGLASLQPSRDAALWCWRRWPARWRAARPVQAERWWAVRVGLGPQGRPRTLRELAGNAPLAPGQVSCELRLGDVAPGIAQWAEVLVHAPAGPSLRAALAARPSLTWLLCNQPLWPQENA